MPVHFDLYPTLRSTVDSLISEAASILPERQQQLELLADYCARQLKETSTLSLNFICTHNSRRSHLAQIWAATAVSYYGLGQKISTYSGGTEATALAPQLADALRRAGFAGDHSDGANPTYQFYFAAAKEPISCFSKRYDDPYNPVNAFAAIMTCSDADENCPYIPGASIRLALTYQDPKRADGTEQETATYDECVHRIGREMFFVTQLIQSKIRK